MCTSKLSSHHIRKSADYVLLLSLIFFPLSIPRQCKVLLALVYSAPIQLSVTQHVTSMGIEESHPQDSALKQDRPAMSLCVTEVSCSDSNATLAK